jgi:hypothetical protein
VSQTIRHHGQRSVALMMDLPGVSAHGFAVFGDRDRGDLQRHPAIAAFPAGAEAHRDHRPAASLRVDVEVVAQAPDRAQSVARRAGRRATVHQRVGHVGDARPAVDGNKLDCSDWPRRAQDEQLALLSMLREVGRQLARHDRGTVRVFFAEAGELGRVPGRVLHRRDVAGLADVEAAMCRAHFHRVMTTRVPAPGVDVMANSFDKRFAPDSPRPSPPVVVNPSRMASGMSAIPGPASSNASRS